MNDLNHIAIIMDGNRRWATQNKLPAKDGHKKGAEVAKKIITKAAELNIKFLTLYTFSSENWNRNEFEVKDLMTLLEFYLENNSKLLIENNIKFKVIGDLLNLPKSIRNKILEYENITKDAKGLNLILAINYGARDEIRMACVKINEDITNNKLKLEDLTEVKISEYLYTHNIPDPDLLIRTSGEQRISNFLLWQIAYTEFYFTDILWPNFTEKDLENTISVFKERKRKYGAN